MIYRIFGWHGGLGDQLQFSTLPEYLTSLGHEVYTWKEGSYRNPEIKKLVWECNPFIKGDSEGEWNCGDLRTLTFTNIGGMIQSWEKLFGLEPKNEFPIVYYQPKEIEELKNKIIVDFTARSLNKVLIYEPIRKYMERYNSNDVLSLKLNSDVIGNSFNPKMPYEEYPVKNIFHFCDIIHSCKKLICSFSGAMVLASALGRNKKLDVECLVQSSPQMIEARNVKLFYFSNINYKEI